MMTRNIIKSKWPSASDLLVHLPVFGLIANPIGNLELLALIEMIGFGYTAVNVFVSTCRGSPVIPWDKTEPG